MRWPTRFTVSTYAGVDAPSANRPAASRPAATGLAAPGEGSAPRGGFTPRAAVERLESRSLLSGGGGDGDAASAMERATHAAEPVAAVMVAVDHVRRAEATPRFGGMPRSKPFAIAVRPAAQGVLAGAPLRQPSAEAAAEDGAAVAGAASPTQQAGAAAADGSTPGGHAGRPPQVKPEPPPEKGTAPRVLVVEDDPVSRRALARVLASHGWEVATAGTAAEGVRQLAAAKPDAVLLDLMLPDGDGERVLERVRAAGHRARVTVMTGAADRDRLARLKDLGADGLIMKPIQVDDVLRRLAAAVTSVAA